MNLDILGKVLMPASSLVAVADDGGRTCPRDNDKAFSAGSFATAQSDAFVSRGRRDSKATVKVVVNSFVRRIRTSSLGGRNGLSKYSSPPSISTSDSGP